MLQENVSGLCGVLCVNPISGGEMSELAMQLVVRCAVGAAIENADGGDGLPQSACAATF